MARSAAISLFAVAASACVSTSSAGRGGAPTAHPASRPADQVVGRVQAVYRRTPQLVTRFRLTAMNKTFGLRSVRDGVIYFKRPGKVRLDVFERGAPAGPIVFSQLLHGNTLWAVDVRGKWYYKSKLTTHDGLPALLFLTDTEGLATDFRARLVTDGTYGAAGEAVLELTPRTSARRFESLVLVIDPSTYRVRKSVVTSAAGDVSELSFFETDTTRMLSDRWFAFDPKAAAARGFGAVQTGYWPGRIRPKPERAPAKATDKTFPSRGWLRAYHDCDEVRRAKPPNEDPPSLAEMRRCAFPGGEGAKAPAGR